MLDISALALGRGSYLAAAALLLLALLFERRRRRAAREAELYRLPNGRRIRHLRPAETDFLYGEIFRGGGYLHAASACGDATAARLALRPGDTVRLSHAPLARRHRRSAHCSPTPHRSRRRWLHTRPLRTPPLHVPHLATLLSTRS